jgi:hypothetical protein
VSIVNIRQRDAARAGINPRESSAVAHEAIEGLRFYLGELSRFLKCGRATWDIE